MDNPKFRIGIFIVLLFVAQHAQAEQRVYPKNQEAVTAAIQSLEWERDPGLYSLAGHGKFRMPEGFSIVRGESAKELIFLINGVELPDTNAVVVDQDTLHHLIFSFFDAGYVSDDDWSELNPDALLREIIDNTNKSNEERKRNGFAPISVVGWEHEPAYDQLTNTVYWAIRGAEGESHVINAIALKLGRKGYSKLTAVIPAEKYRPLSNLLVTTLNNYQIEKGFRYADYTTGDKIAAFGLASLVAITAGSKGKKGIMAGIFAALLVFAKKLWFLIFLPFIFAWSWLKGLFSRADT